MLNKPQRLAERRKTKWSEAVGTLIKGEDIVCSAVKAVAGFVPSKALRPLLNKRKKLPFANGFNTFIITDPYQVYEAFDFLADPENEGLFDNIVIDSLTFLMDMFESVYVIPATDSRSAWGDYQQFFKNLMQDKVAKCKANVIFTAHTLAQYNEEQMVMENKVPVKGALKSQGIEALKNSALAA